jgi:hypothetical protein
MGFCDIHSFTSKPLQYYSILLHVIRWPLYELSICAFIFKKSKPPNKFICSVCPYSHDGVPKLLYFTKINVSNIYEKQYTKRRTNSQSKIVVFYIQFEINFFHSIPLSHLSFIANTLKEPGTQNL